MRAKGDHSGHSTYHALITKFNKRVAAGLTFQASYVLSKILTDADTAWGTAVRGGLFQSRPGKIDWRSST